MPRPSKTTLSAQIQLPQYLSDRSPLPIGDPAFLAYMKSDFEAHAEGYLTDKNLRRVSQAYSADYRASKEDEIKAHQQNAVEERKEAKETLRKKRVEAMKKVLEAEEARIQRPSMVEVTAEEAPKSAEGRPTMPRPSEEGANASTVVSNEQNQATAAEEHPKKSASQDQPGKDPSVAKEPASKTIMQPAGEQSISAGPTKRASVSPSSDKQQATPAKTPETEKRAQDSVDSTSRYNIWDEVAIKGSPAPGKATDSPLLEELLPKDGTVPTPAKKP